MKGSKTAQRAVFEPYNGFMTLRLASILAIAAVIIVSALRAQPGREPSPLSVAGIQAAQPATTTPISTPTNIPTATPTPTETPSPTPTATQTPTATPTSTPTPVPQVLIGAGDISVCGADTSLRTAELLDRLIAQYPQAQIFTAGDNVQGQGEMAEYTGCFEPAWGRFRDRAASQPGQPRLELGGWKRLPLLLWPGCR